MMFPLSRLLRLISMMLISILLFDSVAAVAAKVIDPAAMKAKVQARGVGQGVRVDLVDKTEFKGLIVSISDQSFMLKAKGSDQPQEIQFAQVASVHSDHLGTGSKIAIVVAVVGVTIAIVAIVFVHEFRAGFKGSFGSLHQGR